MPDAATEALWSGHPSGTLSVGDGDGPRTRSRALHFGAEAPRTRSSRRSLCTPTSVRSFAQIRARSRSQVRAPARCAWAGTSARACGCEGKCRDPPAGRPGSKVPGGRSSINAASVRKAVPRKGPVGRAPISALPTALPQQHSPTVLPPAAGRPSAGRPSEGRPAARHRLHDGSARPSSRARSGGAGVVGGAARDARKIARKPANIARRQATLPDGIGPSPARTEPPVRTIGAASHPSRKAAAGTSVRRKVSRQSNSLRREPVRRFPPRRRAPGRSRTWTKVISAAAFGAGMIARNSRPESTVKHIRDNLIFRNNIVIFQ
ncbi:hypothetical protein AB7M35_000903 [Amorphus suaedae]